MMSSRFWLLSQLVYDVRSPKSNPAGAHPIVECFRLERLLISHQAIQSTRCAFSRPLVYSPVLVLHLLAQPKFSIYG
jgi:hypothetical protein